MPDDDARKLFEKALKAGSQRDYRRSAELLTAVLAQSDSFPEALLYLGRARHSLGESGRAIDAFRHYIKAGGERPAGFFFLGRSYLACGRPEAAIACLRKSAEAEPERAPVWALLGAACLRQKRTKAAVDCLEKAVTLAPNDKRIFRGYLNALYARGIRLLVHGEAELAAQMLGFAIRNGLEGAAIRLWRAKALRGLGRVVEALAECEAALRLSPGDPSIRWLRAGLLLAAGRQPEALAEFDAIRASAPGLPALPADDKTLSRLRASVAFREGRWKEAARTALGILKEEPRDAPLRALAAESLRALGEVERARDHWILAIEAAPRESALRLGLALALWDLGEYRRALDAVERARELGADPGEADYYAALCRSKLGEDPASLLPLLQALVRVRSRSGEAPDPRLLLALGEALYRSGRPDLALGWFEKVLILVPEHELSLLYVISSAESMGDETARDRAYIAYLERYPDNAKIRHEFVALFLSRNDWEGAADQLERGLPYGGMGERSRRLLAVCYRNAGRYREAAIAYRELLRADPSSGELLTALAFCLDRDGKTSNALALLDKAPAAAKSSADPWILMGALLARAGRNEGAVDSLRRATELEPANERAWRHLATLYTRLGLGDFASGCAERLDALKAGKPETAADASATGFRGLADAERRSPRKRG